MSWEWLSQNAVGLITLLAVGVGMRTLWGRIDVLKEKVEAQAGDPGAQGPARQGREV